MQVKHDIPAARLTQQPTARDTASKWVAQTFYGQMLKQMRSSPFGTEWANGGRGGEAYQGMLDMHLAEGMTNGPGKPLVDAIVRRMTGQKAYMQTQQLKQTPPAEPSGMEAQQDNPYRDIKIHVDTSFRA
ncbi:MAG: rod-binding protein [Phycisphaerae bacterium]